MIKDGFTLLVSGDTGTKTLQFKLGYIAKFNGMEERLRAPSLPNFADPAAAANPIKREGGTGGTPAALYSDCRLGFFREKIPTTTIPEWEAIVLGSGTPAIGCEQKPPEGRSTIISGGVVLMGNKPTSHAGP